MEVRSEQANYNIEPVLRNSDSHLWHVFKTRTPHPRSMAAAVQRTGLPKPYLLNQNEDRRSFARHRIKLAATGAVTDGVPVTRGEIERRSGCSPHTVNKHKDIWKENLHGTIEEIKTWTRKYFRNAIKWLHTYVNGLCDKGNTGGNSHIGGMRLHQARIVRLSRKPSNTQGNGTRRDGIPRRAYRQSISSEIVQAVNKKVGPAGVPPCVGENNDRGPYWEGVLTLFAKTEVSAQAFLKASLFSERSQQPALQMKLVKTLNTAARSRAARKKAGEPSATRILPQPIIEVAAVPLKRRLSDSVARCMELAQKAAMREQTVSPPDAEMDSAVAQMFAARAEKTKVKREEKCVILRPEEKSALFQKKAEPGKWAQNLERLQSIFDWQKKQDKIQRGEIVEEIANAPAYRKYI